MNPLFGDDAERYDGSKQHATCTKVVVPWRPPVTVFFGRDNPWYVRLHPVHCIVDTVFWDLQHQRPAGTGLQSWFQPLTKRVLLEMCCARPGTNCLHCLQEHISSQPLAGKRAQLNGRLPSLAPGLRSMQARTHGRSETRLSGCQDQNAARSLSHARSEMNSDAGPVGGDA